jgi:hypothetical protein
VPPKVEPKDVTLTNRGEPLSSQPPSCAIDLAERYPELGGPIEDFLPRAWWIWLVVSAVLLAILLPVAILAKSANNLALAIPAIVLTVLDAVLCISLVFLTMMTLRRRAVVCEHGIFIQGLAGATTYLWRDVREVFFQMAGIGFSRQVSIRTQKGNRIVVPFGIRRLFHLYCLICEKTIPLLSPPIRRTLDQGQEVAFGEFIKLTPSGLFWDGKLLPWREIDNLFWGYFTQIGRSAVAVRGKHQTGPIDTTLIPNVLLLLDLLEQRYRLKVEKATTFFE